MSVRELQLKFNHEALEPASRAVFGEQMSDAQIADILGIERTHWWKLRNGRTEPGAPLLLHLMQRLYLSPAHLLTRTAADE